MMHPIRPFDRSRRIETVLLTLMFLAANGIFVFAGHGAGPLGLILPKLLLFLSRSSEFPHPAVLRGCAWAMMAAFGLAQYGIMTCTKTKRRALLLFSAAIIGTAAFFAAITVNETEKLNAVTCASAVPSLMILFYILIIFLVSLAE